MKTKQLLVLLSSIAMISACQNDELPDVQVSKTTLPETTTIQALALDEDVTEEQALDVANQFLKKPSAQTRSAEAAATVEKIADGGETLIYAINYEGGGYALVSAKTNHFPVLAYSDKGQFVYGEDMHPELLNWIDFQEKIIDGEYEMTEEAKAEAIGQWLSYLNPAAEDASLYASAEEMQVMQKRISEIRNQKQWAAMPLTSGGGVFDEVGAFGLYDQIVNKANQMGSPLEYTILAYKKTNVDNGIGAFLTTSWHQGEPFNGKCPAGCPAGCVAIAMAQIMNYYEYPDGYNWSAMPDNTATEETQRLIADIGLAVNMKYTPSSSGASVNDALKAFQDDFKYNASLRSHDNTTAINEVMNKRPVYMRGEDAVEGGHAWVCDGYQNYTYMLDYFVEYQVGGPGYYSYTSDGAPNIDSPAHWETTSSARYMHMNWGWKTNGQGWYILDDISTGSVDFSGNRINIYVSPK